MLPEPSEIALDAKEVGGKDEGLVLIEGEDCLGCHKIDAKLEDRLIRNCRQIHRS